MGCWCFPRDFSMIFRESWGFREKLKRGASRTLIAATDASMLARFFFSHSDSGLEMAHEMGNP